VVARSIRYGQTIGLFKRKTENVRGTPVRAVIVQFWDGHEHDAASHESKSVRWTFTATVRLSDGAVHEVKDKMNFPTGWLMAEGDEISVLVDPESGRVLGFDEPSIAAQVAPRMQLYDAKGKKLAGFRHNLWIEKGEVADAKEAVKEISKLPGRWKDAAFGAPEATPMLPTDDPEPEPIEGVGFDTWIAVQAAAVRRKVPSSGYDTLAQAHGVPAGRWDAVNAAWTRRLQSTPSLAMRYGQAYQAALKR
jgi:hypothetical protein